MKRERVILYVLGGILCAGLAVRASYILEYAGTPNFTYPARDALYHDYWARAIVTGDWTPPAWPQDPMIGSDAYFRAPGYPWFLAWVYLVTGSSYLGPRIVQVLMGLGNCVLLFLLARRLFDSASALVAAALMAFYWVFIYYEGELHSPILSVFLLFLFVLALIRWTEGGHWSAALAAGSVLGLFALVRSNVFPIFLSVGAWMAWASARNRRGWRWALVSVSLLGLGTAVAVSPATIRNYRVSGTFVPVTANVGVNLYINFNDWTMTDSGEYSRWEGTSLPGLGENVGTTGWDCFTYPRVVRALERKYGLAPGTMKYADASKYYTRLALDSMRRHPGATLRLLVGRALLFWGPAEVSNDEIVAAERNHSRLLRSLPGNFAVLSTLFVLGLAIRTYDCARKRGRAETDSVSGAARHAVEGRMLLLLLIATYFVSVLPAAPAARYRVPAIALLLPFGGYAIASLAGLARRRRVRALVAWLIVGAAVGALARTQWVPYEANEAAWNFYRGGAYSQRGDVENAVKYYSKAVELRPRFAMYRINLGAALAEQGRLDEAISQYLKSAEIDPYSSEAYNRLGLARARQGKVDEAIESFSKAVELSPDYPEACVNLGIALGQAGRADEALEAFRKGVAAAPRMPEARANLAHAYEAAGDSEHALAEWAELVRLTPDRVAPRVRMGQLLEKMGRKPEALAVYREALALARESGDEALVLRVQELIDSTSDSHDSASQ
ncbi:tetratricopeptide repeat protein [Candidatus Sumerlaeota bacterium]|nr:tetratricopeptide repeat protein [Candidatus Sumerlaeota bacterium]